MNFKFYSRLFEIETKTDSMLCQSCEFVNLSRSQKWPKRTWGKNNWMIDMTHLLASMDSSSWGRGLLDWSCTCIYMWIYIYILIYEMWMWQLHLRYISNVYESHVEDWMENRSQGTWTPIYLCHLEEEEGGEWLEACGLQHAYVSHVKGWGGRETREIVRHTRLPKTLKDMETIWFRSCLWLPILIYKVLVLQNRLKVFWLFGE